MNIDPLTERQLKIVHEIYKAAEKLGAGLDLLAAIGSWGDTLPEDDILFLLETHNNQPTPPTQG